MADPVSIVLGVLPLIVEALKAYRSTYTKFKTFCHYSREVKRIQKKVNLQKQLFTNECHLLLRLVVQEDHILKAMTGDYGDRRWRDRELEKGIEGQLRSNYESCRETVEEVQTTLEEIEKEMKTFEILAARTQKGECIKDTIRRLRSSVKIAFDKVKYEKYINDLRECNSDLSQLRRHTHEFAVFTQQRPQDSQRHLSKKVRPPDFGTIREASEKLHNALATAWCCGDLAHSRHSIKLCLDAQKVVDTISLDLLISCENPLPESTPRKALQFRSIRQLSVESTHIDVIDKDLITSVSTGQLQEPNSLPHMSTKDQTLEPSSSSVGAKRLTAQGQERGPERRKVRFFDGSGCGGLSQGAPTGSTPPQTITLMSPPILLRSNNLCRDLMSRACAPVSAETGRCRGLFETYHGDFRYIFHSTANCRTRHCGPGNVINSGEPLSLHDVIRQPVDETISMINQLNLARRIVTGVLQYHSTPWLDDTWGLQDVWFFGTRTDVSDQALCTLHLAKELAHCPQTPPSSCNNSIMEGIERSDTLTNCVSTTSVENAMLLYGIRNMTLYNLGVALLEIGYWQELDPYDVVRARKLADPVRLRPPLCPRYQEITRKCLECDFGFGKDLTNTSLRDAVYDGVVSELDDLIASMSIREE